jgi:two-component sensor histidine kinase
MKFLILLFVACSLSFSTRAEPFNPLLGRPQMDSLQATLRHMPPSIARVKQLLRLSYNIVHGIGTTPNNMLLDSADVYARQASALSETFHYRDGQLESAYLLGLLQHHAGFPEAKIVLIKQTIARCQRLHLLAWEGQGWDYQALILDPSPAGEAQKLQCYERALQCFRQLHDQEWEAYILKEIADYHIRQGQHAIAHAKLLQVLALYRAAGHRRLHYTLDLLAATNTTLGNYKEALQDALATIQIAKDTRDTVSLYSFYARTGKIYEALNQRENDIYYYGLALREAHQVHDTYSAMSLATTIARNLIALGRPKPALAQLLKEQRAFPDLDQDAHLELVRGLATCYLALRQYPLAIQYNQQLRALIEDERYASTITYRNKAKAYLTISEVYVATRQYAPARTYLTKLLALSKLTGNPFELAATCLLLFKADSAQGHYPAAIAHYQRYKALNDSIFSEKNSKQVASLQIEYDTQKKEQNILLLTKQNQVQQARLRQREWQRNATLGGALLLTMLLGVSYNRSRIIKRTTHLVEQKQLEINQKNQSLEQVVGEKDDLLAEKEELLVEKEGLLVEKEGLLVEKEWMLKEIHHRVKNNLQIVSELLDSQLDQLQEPRTLAIIRESQNRVQAMALVHQKLYQSQNLARVDMQEYIREIVEHLFTSFRCQAVQEHLAIAAVELDVALATPLGLIINEAVTNSLKYAFPESRRGTISISLSQLPGQRYQLTLADDGVGLPAGFAMETSRTMGLTLIKGLSEQIEADLTFSQVPGVCISLEFESARKAA